MIMEVKTFSFLVPIGIIAVNNLGLINHIIFSLKVKRIYCENISTFDKMSKYDIQCW